MTDKNIGIIQNGIYVIEQKGFSQNVPVFQGGKSDGVFNGGDNSFIVCINDTAYSDIADYTKLLEEKGYTKTFENKIGDNIFYGYSNGENLISVYFIKALKLTRLIAEPFYQFTYNEPVENLATPSVITSSACDRNYYIRLPNNKLVVIDGGWRIEDWSRYKPEELLLQMYEEMVEICGNEQVCVSLWIITHCHSDHAKVLELLYTMPFANKFSIDRILYNFPADEHLIEQTQAPDEIVNKFQNQLKDWHDRAGKDYPYEDIFYNCPFPVYETTIHYENICRNAFKQYNAVNIKAHDGMKFNLSGVIFEVLHTPDDDMPCIYKNMNDTSLVIKMTYQDSVTLWLGDMGVVPGDSCIEMYGDYLKCNAVQVSHHGWGSASWEFFKLLNPEVLLWNNSEFGFQYADKYQGYGKTESSTRLFNMPCVKKNYFCNTIKMQYIDLPFKIESENTNSLDSGLLVSAASDRIFILKNNDGSLIMVNAGWRKEMWERQDKQKLMENLFKEMQAFSGKDTVRVSAWFLTDNDYYNNQFLKHLNEYDFKKNLIIENIVSNSKEIFELNCNHIIPQKGECISFSGTTAKILYTYDGENSSSRENTTVFMISLNGKKIIFTGNMTDCISREILASGEDIECDIVQVANRGLNDGGVLEFYTECKAKINIWNTSEYAYRFFSPTEGYEKSAVSTAVYNSKNCIKNYFCDRILPQYIPLSMEK